VEFFEERYGFISRQQFIDSIEDNKPVDRGVVLTFDDGFKDHYLNVLPILQEKKLWALFYVPTGHYKDKKILNVHRIHHLLGMYDAQQLLDHGLKLVDSSMLNREKIQEFDREIYRDQLLSSHQFRFKRLFNYYLRDAYKTDILDEMMARYLNEEELYSTLYLSEHELVEIEKEGSVVGSHTETHPVLSTLSYAQQKREIEGSMAFLNSFLEMKIKSFCYPYGGAATFNKSTIQVLKELNVHHSFMVGNREIKSIVDRHMLTRLDCNRFHQK
tara:strand:- start:9576 stop:10391 length:816 start_codon:yes stop_codon:yes gene_type:complete